MIRKAVNPLRHSLFYKESDLKIGFDVFSVFGI